MSVLWRSTLICLLLIMMPLASCDQPTTPRQAIPADLHPSGARGWTPELEVTVVHVDFDEGDQGRRVIVEVVLENTLAGIFDGTRARRSVVVLARDDLTLHADGQALRPAAIDGPGFAPATIELPGDRNGRARTRLVFPLTAWPDSLALTARGRSGSTTVPILGRLRAADGSERRAMVALGPDGRVLSDATVRARVDGAWAPADRADATWPWLLPAQAAEVQIEAPGMVAWEGPLPEGDPAILRLRAADGLARAVPQPGWERGDLDIDAFAQRFATPEELAAWVRTHIGVLPTQGLARAPSATLRRGAGGPIDRAELVRTALTRMGRGATMVCGDLSPEQAAIVFGQPQPPPAPPGPLGVLTRRLAAQATAATPLLAGSLADLKPTPARRDRVILVPEWCWIQVKDGETFTDLDLRPPPLDASPLPQGWRATPHITGSLWRVNLTLRGVSRESASDGQARWTTVDLMHYETDAATMTDKGFVFDLYPESPGRLRTMLTLVDARDVAGNLGAPIDAASLERVTLEVEWSDPLRVESVTREIALWEATDGGAPPRALRTLISGDANSAGIDALGARLQAAYGGRWPGDGVRALMADHELLSLLFRHAAGGLEPSAPPMRATVLAAAADGSIRRRTEQVYPPGPAISGRAATPEERARLAAADLLATHALDELAGLPATPPLGPPRWASTVDALLGLSFPDQAAQMASRRLIEAGGIVGVEADRTWRYDVDAGGLSASTAGRPMAGTVIFADGQPISVHQAWRLPILCETSARFRAALGDDGTLPLAECAALTP